MKYQILFVNYTNILLRDQGRLFIQAKKKGSEDRCHYGKIEGNLYCLSLKSGKRPVTVGTGVLPLRSLCYGSRKPGVESMLCNYSLRGPVSSSVKMWRLFTVTA